MCFATAIARCVATSPSRVLIPRKEDRPESSVRNGDLLLAESVLQVVVVGVGGRIKYEISFLALCAEYTIFYVSIDLNLIGVL